MTQIKSQNTEWINIVRSDENSFTVKKYEKGQGYLLKYDIYGKLLQKGTLATVPNGSTTTLSEKEIAKLKHVFDNKATSYKFFWFSSIMQLYKEKQEDSITYKSILIRMVSNAWKYVFVHDSKFSPSDQLPIYLKNIQAIAYLGRSASEKQVEETISEFYNEWKLGPLLMPLLKNVPYRFLSPWIPFTTNDEVMEISRKPENSCLYEIYNGHITIKDIWRDYLIDHYDEITLFIDLSLRTYLSSNQGPKKNEDIFKMKFPSLSQLVRELQSRKGVLQVKAFLLKYDLPLHEKITPSHIIQKIPESKCTIDKDGRKKVEVKGAQWSLKLLEKLFSE